LFSNTSLASPFVLYISFILEFDIVSTPPAIPIEISPDAIALATVATAYKPEEQSLLIA